MADESEQEEASASAAPESDEQVADASEQPAAEPEAPQVDPVEQAHADHAASHGLEPGAEYAVEQHGAPVPFIGTLVGTNDLGVLIRAWGGKFASFHPWASIKSLIHQ